MRGCHRHTYQTGQWKRPVVLTILATNPALRGRHEFKIAAFDKTVAYPVETFLYLSEARALLFVLLLAIVATLDLVLYRRS